MQNCNVRAINIRLGDSLMPSMQYMYVASESGAVFAHSRSLPHSLTHSLSLSSLLFCV